MWPWVLPTMGQSRKEIVRSRRTWWKILINNSSPNIHFKGQFCYVRKRIIQSILWGNIFKHSLKDVQYLGVRERQVKWYLQYHSVSQPLSQHSHGSLLCEAAANGGGHQVLEETHQIWRGDHQERQQSHH